MWWSSCLERKTVYLSRIGVDGVSSVFFYNDSDFFKTKGQRKRGETGRGWCVVVGPEMKGSVQAVSSGGEDAA